MYILFWWCLHLTITESDTVDIANVDMKPEGKFLHFIINNTRNDSGIFLFAPDDTAVLYIKVGPPTSVSGLWNRRVTLSSTKNGALINKRMTWLDDVACKTNPTDSTDFEFFAYYNSGSWKVCGDGIQPGCSLKRPFPYHFGPETVSRVAITTDQVVGVTACITNTGECPNNS